MLTQSTATSYAAGMLDNTRFYEWQLVAWDHVNNSTTQTATTAGVSATKTYYFGATRVAVRENGVLSYLHSDQLSSVSASTDANGQVTGRQLFELFGAVRAEYGEVDGSWGWATHRKSEATRLTFMRARWYAPSVGRFVQPDSIVPGPGNPQVFNRYSYVQGRPLTLADPTGHCGERPDGKDACYDGKTATTPPVVRLEFPKSKPAEIRASYKGSPNSKKYVVFEFRGYTQTYQKVVAPGTSVDAGIAGGGIEVSTKDTLSCNGKCPAPKHADIAVQPWGKVGVFKIAINSADGSVSVEASVVAEVGNFGFEVNDNYAEIGLGPIVYGVEGQSSTYMAMSERNYYALSVSGEDPAAIATRLVAEQGGRVSSPTIYFGAEVGTVGPHRTPYAKLPNGGSVLLNYFVTQ